MPAEGALPVTFDRFLVDLSAHFVALPGERMDTAIHSALDRIGLHLDLDRIILGQFPDAEGSPGVTHSWGRPGVEPIRVGTRYADPLPTVTESLRRGEVVALRDVAALGPEWETDLQEFRRSGARSHISLPFAVAGVPVGVLTAVSVRRTHAWSDHDVERLRLLAQVFGDALTRRDMEREVATLSRFRGLIGRLSAHLLGASPGESDEAINEALAEIGQCLAIGRIALLQASEAGSRLVLTHGYAAEPDQNPPRFVVSAELPWFCEAVLQGRKLSIASGAEMPERAVAERRYLAEQGIKSFVMIPIRIGGIPTGGLSYSDMQRERVWPDALIEELEIVSQLVGNALGTRRAQEELARSEQRHRWLAESVPGTYSYVTPDGRFEFASRGAEVLFGRSPDTIVGRQLREVLPAETLDLVRPYLDAALSGRPTSWEQPLGEASDGPRWVKCRLAPEVDEAEHVKGVMWLATDITDLKRAEEKLKLALVEKEKLMERLEAENLYLRDEGSPHIRYDEIIGQSPAIRKVLRQAEQVAATDSSVLLLGDTGTGKQLVARAIHRMSKRGRRALITVDCASLPSALIESELFGHEKGAYTGAVARQPGKFEVADGSTILLDEIGDLPQELQAKLLRVLQEGEFERLGSTRTQTTDVRVIAATNRDLVEAVEAGRFREDLFYRLHVFPITVPPLSDRREDIPLLVWKFVEEFAAAQGRSIDTIPRATMAALEAHPWPGNVRELRHAIERAVILSPGQILIVDEAFLGAGPRPKRTATPVDTLESVERAHVIDVLVTCRWKVKGPGNAAERLGLNPSTLRARMKKLGIERPARPGPLSAGPSPAL